MPISPDTYQKQIGFWNEIHAETPISLEATYLYLTGFDERCIGDVTKLFSQP
ncbi:hypothetical protein PGB90_007174 [Kerria lacca]